MSETKRSEFIWNWGVRCRDIGPHGGSEIRIDYTIACAALHIARMHRKPAICNGPAIGAAVGLKPDPQALVTSITHR